MKDIINISLMPEIPGKNPQLPTAPIPAENDGDVLPIAVIPPQLPVSPVPVEPDKDKIHY